MRRSTFVVLSMGIASLLACGEQSKVSDGSSADLVQVLHDGTWVLTIDRTLRAGVSTSGLPTTPLSELDFAPVAVTTIYRLVVSQRGARVEIVEPRMVGQVEQRSAERMTYALNEGTVAGGRLVVWRASGGLQGELTLYGAGVPVTRSERGAVGEAD